MLQSPGQRMNLHPAKMTFMTMMTDLFERGELARILVCAETSSSLRRRERVSRGGRRGKKKKKSPGRFVCCNPPRYSHDKRPDVADESWRFSSGMNIAIKTNEPCAAATVAAAFVTGRQRRGEISTVCISITYPSAADGPAGVGRRRTGWVVFSR